MGDFRIKVDADLDLSKIQSQLKGLDNKKIKLDVDTGGLKSSIESALTGIKAPKVKPDVDLSSIKNKMKSIKMKVDTKSFDATISSLSSKLGKFDKNSSNFGNASSSIEKLKTSYKDLGKAMSEYKKNSSDANAKNVAKVFDTVQSNAKLATNELKILGSEGEKSISKLTAMTESKKMTAWLSSNSRAAKDYGDTIKGLASAMENASTVSEKNNILQKFNQIKAEASSLGKTGISWADNFKRGFLQIGQFVGVYGVLRQGVQVAKDMAGAVIEVDTAMTELRKVSDAPSAQLTSYFEQATDSAKKYGATISDVINSTADWSRLGYSLSDASKLSDATTLLQKVGDNMTQESSSEGLISILKGFNKDASDVSSIIDVINQVANTEPIDTSGITSALQRSASSLSAAGNDINQSVSMITAANSVVQDPESVGTAFKVMSMRIRGASTELEQAGLDTEGMTTSTAKLREEMQALSGVDIMQDENTFKSTYDILDELADKWGNLTDIQQASVTELVAGRRLYLCA